jgi:hypothetical protein
MKRMIRATYSNSPVVNYSLRMHRSLVCSFELCEAPFQQAGKEARWGFVAADISSRVSKKWILAQEIF